MFVEVAAILSPVPVNSSGQMSCPLCSGKWVGRHPSLPAQAVGGLPQPGAPSGCFFPSSAFAWSVPPPSPPVPHGQILPELFKAPWKYFWSPWLYLCCLFCALLGLSPVALWAWGFCREPFVELEAAWGQGLCPGFITVPQVGGILINVWMSTPISKTTRACMHVLWVCLTLFKLNKSCWGAYVF